MAEELQPRISPDPDLLALSPDKFEELIFLLAHAEDDRVVPVRARDHGLDARLPSSGDRTTERGWQAKHFTGDIKFDQCEFSVRRAMAFWRPRRITFCFPRELSAKEQGDFRQRLIERFPQLRLDFWGGTEIRRRMRDSEEGRRATRYLFGDPTADLAAYRRALATGGELDSADQALARLGTINHFLQRDPHFRYGVEIAEIDGPESTPAPETLMSVEVHLDDSRIRLDASERYPGAGDGHGPAGAIVFKDAESARKAHGELTRITERGGSTTIEGATVRMDRLPKGFEELMPEELPNASIEIIALPADAAQRAIRAIPVLLAAGESEIAVDLRLAKSPAGWTGAIAGRAGGLEVTMLLRPKKEGGIESQINWHHTLGEGATIEQLLSLEIMTAAYRGASVEMRAVDTGQILLSGTISDSSEGAELEALDGRLQLLGWLAELEAWTGEQFTPPAQWEKDDAEALAAAIPWIRKPVRDDVADIRIALTYRPEVMPPDPEEPHQFAVTQSLAIELFGDEVHLGERMVHLPKGRIVEIDQMKHSAAVVPVDDTHGSVRLFPPDESHPPDAE